MTDRNLLADVLVTLVGRALTKDQIGSSEWAQLTRPDVDRAITDLKRRGLVRHLGGGHWSATQRECAGSCSRQGRDLRGQAVEFDPETLRWFCPDCWEAEIAQVRRIVNGEDAR